MYEMTIEQLQQFNDHVKAAFRTQKGNVTQQGRQDHGIRSGLSKGKFPIDDQTSAKSAMKLLLTAKPPLSRSEIEGRIRQAAKYLSAEDIATVRKRIRKRFGKE